MANMALYNRYRPRTFAEVVGQQHVTDALSQALRSGRIHHAYLFSGPRGCGKTSSARILAASLNCVNGPTPTPCGECEQCVSIRLGSSLDVVEIDAASHGGVDDARDLRERALYVPASARYRIFVIDEAHQVSRDGFNALLKIVEEPPDYLVFIFATTEPDKVLPTIRSRTFSYQFRLVPPGILREHLARICAAEEVSVAPEVLPLVVRAGAGSVRDAMSVLDQLIAGGALDYTAAAALLGVTDAVLLDDSVEALSTHDGAAMFGVIERLINAGHDPRAFAKDLLERLRDLIMLQAVPEAVEQGLVDELSPDLLDRMQRQASSLGAAELSRAADIVHTGLIDMRGTTSPRLLLELVAARLLLPAADHTAASVLARLDAVERRVTLGAPSQPASAGSPQRTAPAAQPVTPPSATSAPAAPGAPSPVAALPTSARAASTAGAAPTPGSPSAGRPADSSAHRPAKDPQHPAVPAEVQAPRMPASAPTATAPPEGENPVAARSAGSLNVAALTETWPLVLDAVKKRSRVPHAMLDQHARVAGLDGDRLTLTFALAPIARQFESGTGSEVLAEALTEILGGTWRISVIVGDGVPVTNRPADSGSSTRPLTPDPIDLDEQVAGSTDVAPPPDPVDLLRATFGATVIDEIDA